MDKIAFFYELGYNMVKEAQNNEKKEEAGLLSKALGAAKATGGETLDIYKSLLGIGKGDTPYFKNIAAMFGKAGLPVKIVAPALPLAALGGGGYGLYRATRKKSKLDQLKDMLGID